VTSYEIVLIAYGLAFFVIAATVWVRRRRPARRRSDQAVHWLAAFAASHGLVPFLILLDLLAPAAAVALASLAVLARFAVLSLTDDSEQTNHREREKAERRAAENEQRFKDFAEAASDWLWEMDENLRFSYVSDLAQKLAGLPVDKMLGMTREELLKKQEDREKWRPHLEDLQARRPFRDFRYTDALASEDGATHALVFRPYP